MDVMGCYRARAQLNFCGPELTSKKCQRRRVGQITSEHGSVWERLQAGQPSGEEANHRASRRTKVFPPLPGTTLGGISLVKNMEESGKVNQTGLPPAVYPNGANAALSWPSGRYRSRLRACASGRTKMLLSLPGTKFFLAQTKMSWRSLLTSQYSR